MILENMEEIILLSLYFKFFDLGLVIISTTWNLLLGAFCCDLVTYSSWK